MVGPLLLATFAADFKRRAPARLALALQRVPRSPHRSAPHIAACSRPARCPPCGCCDRVLYRGLGFVILMPRLRFAAPDDAACRPSPREWIPGAEDDVKCKGWAMALPRPASRAALLSGRGAATRGRRARRGQARGEGKDGVAAADAAMGAPVHPRQRMERASLPRHPPRMTCRPRLFRPSRVPCRPVPLTALKPAPPAPPPPSPPNP